VTGIRLDDPDRTAQTLQSARVRVLTGEELYAM
jgi:hypothetical protein